MDVHTLILYAHPHTRTPSYLQRDVGSHTHTYESMHNVTLIGAKHPSHTNTHVVRGLSVSKVIVSVRSHSHSPSEAYDEPTRVRIDVGLLTTLLTSLTR